VSMEKASQLATEKELQDDKSDPDLRSKKRPKLTEEDEKLEELWTSIKCKDLTAKQKVITIKAKSSVLSAAEVLARNRVSSAPVVSEEDEVICGMFDFRDLGATLIKAFSQELSEEDKKSLTTLKAVLQKHSAELSTDMSKHDKFYSVNEDHPLLDAVEYFGKGLHRILVLDNEKKTKRNFISIRCNKILCRADNET